MQRTRSKSTAHTSNSPKRKAPMHDPNVIEISDDSEDDSKRSKPTKRSKTLKSAKPKTTTNKNKSNAKARAITNDDEILVISDGELLEPTASSSSSGTVVNDLLRRIEDLEKENTSLRRDKAESDLALAKAKGQSDPDKLVMDKAELEDLTTCEICSDRMWQPVVLPECGHAFCQKCLQDWFNQILAKHMQAHPRYNVHAPVPQVVLDCLTSPLLRHHPQASLILQQWRHTLPPQPTYTCPSCRHQCKTRPADDFPLKKVVAMTAAAMGESNEPTRALNKNPRFDAWSGFFPSPR